MKKDKKIYLKDIKDNRELLKTIFENNNKLQEKAGEIAYENNMEQQVEFGELCLGKNWNKYIDMYDNYSSFYLRVKNAEKMIENIDKNYLTTEEEELYNKAVKILEIRNNEEYGTDFYWEQDMELDEVSANLLELIEKDLHDYENIEEEDVFETFIFDLQENYMYEDLYYYENDNTYNLYEDVSYTKNWN